MSEWIDVKAEKPKLTINTTFERFSQPILFVDANKTIYVGDCYAPTQDDTFIFEGYEVEELIDGFGYEDNTNMEIVNNVTHWMPLPEPPKED